MQYLVVFTPTHRDGTPPADFQEQELLEQQQARRLYAQGHARQVWAIDTQARGAVVLFEAASREHLQELIDTFPLVQRAYAEYEVHPLAPYPAFGSKD